MSLGRVKRLMKDNGIRAKHKRRYQATTDSKHALAVAPNLWDLRFYPSTGPGLDCGYHVHPDPGRLVISGCRDGLVHAHDRGLVDG